MIKVFSELFVGLRNDTADGVPLGFAAPYEDNAACKKRQDTIKSWATRYNKPSEFKVVSNEPREGFKITDDVKRHGYFGSGNVVFRIEDPHGFELEIQSQNLMAIIANADIQKGGLIQGKCCWGREGAKNVLLHETSAEYKSAFQKAEAIVPIRKGINAGDTVIMMNGEEAVYLGQYWAYGYSENFSADVSTVKAKSDLSWYGLHLEKPKQYHFFQKSKIEDAQIEARVELKIIEKSKDGNMSEDDAIRLINTNGISVASKGLIKFVLVSKSNTEKTRWEFSKLSAEDIRLKYSSSYESLPSYGFSKKANVPNNPWYMFYKQNGAYHSVAQLSNGAFNSTPVFVPAAYDDKNVYFARGQVDRYNRSLALGEGGEFIDRLRNDYLKAKNEGYVIPEFVHEFNQISDQGNIKYNIYSDERTKFSKIIKDVVDKLMAEAEIFYMLEVKFA